MSTQARFLLNISCYSGLLLLKWYLQGGEVTLEPRPNLSSLAILIQVFRRASPTLSNGSPPELDHHVTFLCDHLNKGYEKDCYRMQSRLQI